MKLYRHKKTNALMKEIKQTKNLVICFNLDEDMRVKRVNNFCSRVTRQKKSICKKENLREVA